MSLAPDDLHTAYDALPGTEYDRARDLPLIFGDRYLRHISLRPPLLSSNLELLSKETLRCAVFLCMLRREKRVRLWGQPLIPLARAIAGEEAYRDMIRQHEKFVKEGM